MSKRGLALGVSLLALSATQALAQSGGTPGPYVRLDGGWSHPVPMTSSSLPTVTSGSVKRDCIMETASLCHIVSCGDHVAVRRKRLQQRHGNNWLLQDLGQCLDHRQPDAQSGK